MPSDETARQVRDWARYDANGHRRYSTGPERPEGPDWFPVNARGEAIDWDPADVIPDVERLRLMAERRPGGESNPNARAILRILSEREQLQARVCELEEALREIESECFDSDWTPERMEHGLKRVHNRARAALDRATEGESDDGN